MEGLRQPTKITLNVKRNRKPIVGSFLKSASRNSHVPAKHSLTVGTTKDPYIVIDIHYRGGV